VLRVAHPLGRASERRYAAEVLLGEFLGLEYTLEEQDRRDVELTMAGSSDGRSLLIADVLFALEDSLWLTPGSLPATPLESWELQGSGIEATPAAATLPVLYGRRLSGGSFVEASETGVQLGVDVFGSAFFMLTRYEELVAGRRDRHERFPADAALAVREHLLERPIVNEYLQLLWWALQRLWPRLERRPRSFRQLPSHDVDAPLCPSRGLRVLARRAGGDLVRRRDPGLAARRLRASLASRQPDRDVCNTFDFIMEHSERLGLRSAFHFMAGSSDPRFDAGYSLDDPWLRKLLRRIHERGHEIGFHPSYGTYRDAERTAAELERLRAICEQEAILQPTWGSRQHYLRFETPTTWRHLDAAGLAYDSTLTFPERPGFRCGVCFEYPVYDLERRRRLVLRERPLIVMEVSLLQYQSLEFDDALARIVELKRACRRFDGDFTLLWHNDHLVSRRERKLYVDALEAP
jgi:hypothetical protein